VQEELVFGVGVRGERSHGQGWDCTSSKQLSARGAGGSHAGPAIARTRCTVVLELQAPRPWIARMLHPAALADLA